MGILHLKRSLITLAAVFIVLGAGISGFGYLLGGAEQSIPELIQNRSARLNHDSREITGNRLRIMTLNLCHGRGDGFFSFMVSESRAHEHLAATAALIQQAAPHVVALQEADESTFFSGGFNHVQLLTRQANMFNAVQGRHINGPGLIYGTALISVLPIRKPLSRTFEPSPPTQPKGFVMVTVPWPGPSFKEVRIVSVHFDYLLSSTRRQQADILLETLSQQPGPLIIAGDFNAGWEDAGSVVRYLVPRLNLKAWNPLSTAELTFPASGSRIDWILISSELAFNSYRVLPRIVSDHLAVIAEIQPAPPIAEYH